MKKLLTLVFISLLVISCKKEEKNETPEEVTTEQTEGTVPDGSQPVSISLNGDFLYDGKAAVLQVGDNIYAVEVDEKCKELAEKCKEFQDTKYDFVRVAVLALMTRNPDEGGWEKLLKITNIFYVRESITGNNITIKSKN